MRALGKSQAPQTILVVDDDEDIREVVRVTLQDIAGHRVLFVASGLEAIEVARSESPHLVLLDSVMPVMSGLATLKRFRDDPALCRLPVVFMTANVGATDRARYSAMGAIGVITKPFDPLSLIEQVGAWLAVVDREAPP